MQSLRANFYSKFPIKILKGDHKDTELLINTDHPNFHLYTETRSRNHNEPVALHTALRWVLFGRKK